MSHSVLCLTLSPHPSPFPVPQVPMGLSGRIVDVSLMSWPKMLHRPVPSSLALSLSLQRPHCSFLISTQVLIVIISSALICFWVMYCLFSLHQSSVAVWIKAHFTLQGLAKGCFFSLFFSIFERHPAQIWISLTWVLMKTDGLVVSCLLCLLIPSEKKCSLLERIWTSGRRSPDEREP